ncbi:MAG: hypothetical protein KDA96_23175 [Planctomycetaceae bacterium]|nr:hypothetical protein [Planctomycetaceae bacterium]MCA9065998.1 hypothetical protein [Planctomycetaceae bacterium]
MSIDTVSFEVPLGVTCVVDVFDQTDLFDLIDNERVTELSCLGGRAGFSNAENVRKATGISVRRILRPHVSVLDLADAICRRLQDTSGITLSEFGTILLCHSGTDSSACQRLARDIEQKFGLPPQSIQAFNHGCSGFLKLLHAGTIALDSDPAAEPVALLSVETPETWHDASDRLFCGIVSAGATAVVLEAGRGLPISMVHADNYRIPADRRLNADPLFRQDSTEVFCFRGNPCQRTVMRMNAEPVFLNGIELMLEQLREAIAVLQPDPGRRVIVLPHQPSGKLLKALIAAATAEFPNVEFLNNLDQFGNTISSTIPTMLARLPEVMAANGRPPIGADDYIIMLAAGICMDDIESNMAAGFASLQWQPAVCNTRPEKAAVAAEPHVD